MPSGRLSTYSAEIAATICERMANGESLREICRDEGFPPEGTVRGWAIADINGFATQYTRAKEARTEHWAEEIIEIADDASNDYMTRQLGDDGPEVQVIDHEHINRSRLRVDTRKWLMSKIAPKNYGDRQDVQHSGSVNITISKDDEKL